MKTVYKYDLVFPSGTIRLPKDAQILSVGYQNDSLMPFKLWALVDPNEKETELHNFEMYGTGHRILTAVSRFIGTVHTPDKEVYHVFLKD